MNDLLRPALQPAFYFGEITTHEFQFLGLRFLANILLYIHQNHHYDN